MWKMLLIFFRFGKLSAHTSVANPDMFGSEIILPDPDWDSKYDNRSKKNKKMSNVHFVLLYFFIFSCTYSNFTEMIFYASYSV